MVTQQNGIHIINGQVTTEKTYYGLSTDSKPTGIANGSCFIEMDTGKLYFWNAAGTAWVEWGA